MTKDEFIKKVGEIITQPYEPHTSIYNLDVDPNKQHYDLLALWEEYNENTRSW